MDTIERNRHGIFSEEELMDMECYVFNDKLGEDFDDGICEHCIHYFTTKCPHIEEFIEDEDFD